MGCVGIEVDGIVVESELNQSLLGEGDGKHVKRVLAGSDAACTTVVDVLLANCCRLSGWLSEVIVSSIV